MIKIAVFASGSGTNAENVASYFAAGEKARVTLILSNRPDAPVLERARRLGIGTEIFDRDTFYNSDRVVERLRREGIGYIVLAGFLWLVPDNLLGAYGGRILNVHPSLLPRHGGKGMYGDRVHRAVVESGDRETGITTAATSWPATARRSSRAIRPSGWPRRCTLWSTAIILS